MIIRCVDNNLCSTLTLSKEYIVIEEAAEYYVILDDKNEENLQKLIEEESIVHQKKLEYLIKRQKDLFGEDEKNKKSGHYLVLDFAIQRETFKKDWLQSLLEELKN